MHAVPPLGDTQMLHSNWDFDFVELQFAKNSTY